MAVVTGGLGLPEEGSLAAFGLGAASSDPNALVAHLSGSGAVVADLTSSGPVPGFMVAALSGSGALSSDANAAGELAAALEGSG